MNKYFFLFSSIILAGGVIWSIWYVQQPKIGPLGESNGIPFNFWMTMICTACVAIYSFLMFLHHRKTP